MKREQNVHQPPYLGQLTTLLLISFSFIALALIFWSVLRAGTILARSDNPRLVEAELRIQRGAILDRNGLTLAENGGTTARQQRQYPILSIGPAVGYYSFRHGTAGVEEGFDDILRGEGAEFWVEAWRKMLHEPRTGQAIQLSLDAAWQQQAENLLGNNTGALLLLELDANSDAALIRAMVSHPSYDPNLLDEQFETLMADNTAPLLNRATQGQYQPGLVLQPFLLANSLDAQLLQMAETVTNANRPVALNGMVRRCALRPPELATWADVLAFRCPGPLLDLGETLDTAELSQIFTDWGFAAQPDLPLNTETPPQEPLADAALAAIGQDNLTVTPLQVGLALAALGQDGRFPTPVLVTAVQDSSGNWLPETTPASETTAATSTSTRAILRALPTQNGIAEHNVLVLSGPEGSTNGWYLALAPATAPRYALVIVVENSDSLETAAEIGRALFSQLP